MAAKKGEPVKSNRGRKIKSPAELWRKWEAYKEQCYGPTAMYHAFSQGKGVFISRELPHRTACTIKGFCLFLHISRNSFYASYAKNPRFEETCTLIREESEVDALEKFETGELPARLAPLWLGRFFARASAGAESGKGNALLESLLKLERAAPRDP